MYTCLVKTKPYLRPFPFFKALVLISSMFLWCAQNFEALGADRDEGAGERAHLLQAPINGGDVVLDVEGGQAGREMPLSSEPFRRRILQEVTYADVLDEVVNAENPKVIKAQGQLTAFRQLAAAIKSDNLLAKVKAELEAEAAVAQVSLANTEVANQAFIKFLAGRAFVGFTDAEQKFPDYLKLLRERLASFQVTVGLYKQQDQAMRSLIEDILRSLDAKCVEIRNFQAREAQLVKQKKELERSITIRNWIIGIGIPVGVICVVVAVVGGHYWWK